VEGHGGEDEAGQGTKIVIVEAIGVEVDVDVVVEVVIGGVVVVVVIAVGGVVVEVREVEVVMMGMRGVEEERGEHQTSTSSSTLTQMSSPSRFRIV
jgi:hypothetical protein